MAERFRICFSAASPLTAETTTISALSVKFRLPTSKCSNDAGLHAKQHSQRSGAANHFLHGEFEFDYSWDPGDPVPGWVSGASYLIVFSGRRRGPEHQYFPWPRAKPSHIPSTPPTPSAAPPRPSPSPSTRQAQQAAVRTSRRILPVDQIAETGFE